MQGLMKAASAGKLNDPIHLKTQVERMLADDKANAFVEHFTDSWLRLNTLGSMPPDSKAFESYYRDRLQELFKQETRSFFADLLDNNGSILNLLNSDYTFVNDALASHYGIDGVSGEHFRKVSLTPQHHRGGLLGQGSVLTVSANGIETSSRRTWGVGTGEHSWHASASTTTRRRALEPDTRGAITIREQLSKHRNVAACADCHSKIDPAGFALEFYDPIGRYRSHYAMGRRQGPTVDGSGQLPTGETFEDERGLKQLLLDRKERFAEALSEKLLTYATGRSMTFRDQPDIKKSAAVCGENGYGLRDMINSVVSSDTFQRR